MLLPGAGRASARSERGVAQRTVWLLLFPLPLLVSTWETGEGRGGEKTCLKLSVSLSMRVLVLIVMGAMTQDPNTAKMIRKTPTTISKLKPPRA